MHLIDAVYSPKCPSKTKNGDKRIAFDTIDLVSNTDSTRLCNFTSHWATAADCLLC